MLMLFE